MICKQCGLEYPDDLTACPGCHAPNGDVEAQPMSESERDAFDGVTIETPSDDDRGDTYRVYDRDDVRREQENEVKREKRQALWALVRNNLKVVLVVAAILALIVMLLPSLIFFFLVAIGVYGAITLMNYFFRP